MLIEADWERDGSFSVLRMDRGEALSEIMNIKKMLKRDGFPDGRNETVHSPYEQPYGAAEQEVWWAWNQS